MTNPRRLRTWDPALFASLCRGTRTSASEVAYILTEAGLRYSSEGIYCWRKEGSKGPPHQLVVDLIAAHFAQKGAGSKVELSAQLRGLG